MLSKFCKILKPLKDEIIKILKGSMVKKIVLFLCTALFLCGCSRSGPQDVPEPEQNKAPSYHYTGYYYA